MIPDTRRGRNGGNIYIFTVERTTVTNSCCELGSFEGLPCYILLLLLLLLYIQRDREIDMEIERRVFWKTGWIYMFTNVLVSVSVHGGDVMCLVYRL